MNGSRPEGALARVPILAGLDATLLAALEAESRVRRYPAGQVLCCEGDPGEDLLLLETGKVRVSRIAPNGLETVLAEVEAPIAFGELALIDGEPRSAMLTAISDVQVRYLGRRTVLDLIAREPTVALAMMQGMARMVRATNDRLRDLLTLDAPGRLAKWLLDHAVKDGVVALDQSQESLARSLGTTRETVNRSLHRFERLGLVEIAGQTVRIRDVNALRMISEG